MKCGLSFAWSLLACSPSGARRAARTSLFALVFALCQGAPALATTVPWRTGHVPSTPAKAPVAAYLRELADAQGIAVQVDRGIDAALGIDFAGPPATLLESIERRHGLVAYFDGATLHVTRKEQNVATLLRVSSMSAAQFEASLRRLGIADRRFPLKFDAATSTVMVSGPPRYVQLVREAAAAGKPRAPTDEEIRVFALRYGSAKDRRIQLGSETISLPGVASLVRALFHGGDPSARSDNAAHGDSAGSGPSAGPAQRPSQRNTAGGTLDVPPPMHETYEQLLGKFNRTTRHGDATSLPQVHADPRTNSVVVRDYAYRMDMHERLIQSLDVRPRMIELHIQIIEAETSALNDLKNNGLPAGLGARALDAKTRLADRAGGRSAGADGATDGGLALRGESVDGRIRIISEPRLTVLDNVVAEFGNARSLMAPQQEGSQPAAVRLEAGTRIRVLPQTMVDPDGTLRVQMTVSLHDGGLSGRAGEEATGTSSHSLNTTAVVRSGESLMMGGLSYDYRGVVRQRTGGATRTVNHGRSERLYIITPRILEE